MNTIALCGFNGTPTTTGASDIPERYLIPATKEQIDRFIEREKWMQAPWGVDAFGVKQKPSVLWNPDCAGDGKYICHRIMAEIDRHNLYFVNGIIDYDKLMWAYDEAKRALEDLPRLPSIGESFKNMGQFLVGAVAGFIAGGPVGLFVGASGAIKKMIADEKALRAEQSAQLIDINNRVDVISRTPEARTERSVKDFFSKKEVQVSLLAAGILGAGYLILKD